MCVKHFLCIIVLNGNGVCVHGKASFSEHAALTNFAFAIKLKHACCLLAHTDAAQTELSLSGIFVLPRFYECILLC